MSIFDDVAADIDDLFPPRPGGAVAAKRDQAAAGQLPEVATPSVPEPYKAVRVRTEPPELGTARTLTLSAANPVLLLLGQDAQRRSAVVIAVDNDVYIASDHGLARQAAGGAAAEGVFYLPEGIGIPIDTQARLWVAATTTTGSSRVSVLITKDSQP